MDLQPFANLPERIEPVYQCEQANEPIQLFQGQATLIDPHTEARYEGNASLTLEWLPNPHLVCRFTSDEIILLSSRDYSSSESKKLSIECEIRGRHIQMKILPTQRQTDSEQGTWLRGVVVEPEPFTVGMVQTLDYAILHLVNFHNYVGSPMRDKSGQSGYAGRMEMHTPDWRITIDQLPKISELEDQTRAGGYAITHVARVERADGTSFSTESLQGLLVPIGLFLSFLRGAWSVPVLAVGVDKQSKLYWEQWETPSMSRIASGNALSANWFPKLNLGAISSLKPLFGKFCKLWQDADWQKALRLSIAWYAAASGTPSLVEGRLIMAQIALELLSWLILAEKGGTFSEEALRKKRAAEKMQHLLSWAGIPDTIPQEYGCLSNFAKQKGWNKGSNAIASLRNMVIHASKTNRDAYYATGGGVVWEASQLALLYIELVLLRLLGYQGVYYDRIEHKWAGEVKPVPWAGENRPE